MKFGIPILGERVSPRCSFAGEVLIVTERSKGRIISERLPSVVETPVDLVEILESHNVDTLICGGISQATRETLLSHDIDIIDNVACSTEEILDAIRTGRLRSGYGMIAPTAATDHECAAAKSSRDGPISELNCLTCTDRKCFGGEPCWDLGGLIAGIPKASRRMIDATLDVSQEKDRILCRVSELVYFCLEMSFYRIGIAYCTDLWEPAEILNGVLRRFFEITPVCCKIGGIAESEMLGMSDSGEGAIACNPLGQAEVLNRAKTQLNVIVGLCLGADCLFTSASHAPVTTLLVKDKSLAHNPIGALYSEYYLKESLQAAERRSQGIKRNAAKPVTPSMPVPSTGGNKQEESP